MQSILSMRDRRNTSLSISSNSSSTSTASTLAHDSSHEKRYTSPPVSPTLPAPVTKGSSARLPSKRSAAVKILMSLCALLVLWNYFYGQPLQPRRLDTSPEESIGEVILAEPTATLVLDASGLSKWTVAIPHNSSFPLHAAQYQAICRQGDELSSKLTNESRSFGLRNWRRKSSYYTLDRNFLDVADLEPLPDDVCNSSLTFVMDTADASFGKSLLMLWMSYGLAKKEGRAFFLDDTRWPFGKYTSYFPPLPAQGCSPPPQHHIVPCPHQAKHLVISAATAKWSFGRAFEQEFTPVRKHGVHGHRRIFDLIRAGYEDLFELVGDDAAYATSRIAKLTGEAASHHGSLVAMQIRRGDLHPSEYQFSRDYLPLARYAGAARILSSRLLGGNLSKPEASNNAAGLSSPSDNIRSPLLLASDDPDIINSPELSQAATPFPVQKAQERIMLATKAALDQTSPKQPIRQPGSAYVKHVDENSGWEGGFFSALFFSLGRPSPSASQDRSTGLADAADGQVLEQVMRMRELVGRAYLLDLAVLGESDGVVCAVSSAACRLLGVMLGWEAVAEGRWFNVDDRRTWSWDGRR